MMAIFGILLLRRTVTCGSPCESSGRAGLPLLILVLAMRLGQEVANGGGVPGVLKSREPLIMMQR